MAGGFTLTWNQETGYHISAVGEKEECLSELISPKSGVGPGYMVFGRE